jgi:RNA polymerase sigma factor (sigma-70 family)
VAVSDPQLVSNCLRGDAASWTELWRRYGGLVKAVARRTGCTADESRDVLQQVALVALAKLDTLRDGAKLAAWLGGVARFQALELIRQRRHGEDLTEAVRVADHDAEQQVVRDQELALLTAALHRLDARCQRMLRRLELDEPPATYQQVADEEGLSPTSVGPIRRRCLDRLRKHYDTVSRTAGSPHIPGGGSGDVPE